jgi:prepilin-type N-terminal cleavage/methylation domain-containing protein
MSSPLLHPGCRPPRRAFTLAELLVAVGIIAILVTLTTIAVRGIAKDARLSSAENAVIAALDNARALAMKENSLAMVVFRPRLQGDDEMFVEAVAMQWNGETYVNPSGSGFPIIDRFVPVEGIAPRRLPVGIKVAAPLYGTDDDGIWTTQSHLPAIDPSSPVGAPNEVPGAMIAVTFAPDGTVVTRNSQTDSHRFWPDFENDPGAIPTLTWRGDSGSYAPGFFDFASVNLGLHFEHYTEDDESFVTAAPFLVVYDDDEARDLRTTDWTNFNDYVAELTGPNGHISRFADRIHFNRYTGVAMK